jgi:hypothetical protein
MFRASVLPILFMSLAACQMTPPAPIGAAPPAIHDQVASDTATNDLATSDLENSQLASTGAPLALTTVSGPSLTSFADYGDTVSHPSVGGTWRVAGGASNGCAIRFEEAEQAFAPASIHGCPSSPLAATTAWNVAGDQIRLLSGDGQALALLYIDRPDLLTGYTADGQELVLSR